MIFPLILLMALAQAPDEDCPLKAAKALAPLPVSRIQTYIQKLEIDEPEQKLQSGGRSRAERAEKARERAISRDQETSIRDAMQQAHKELEKLGITRQYLSDTGFGPGFAQSFKFYFGGQEPRVNLDIDNLPIRDAIKHVSKLTKLDFKIDDEIAKDIRVTLKAPNVRLSSALDMITDAGGIYWSRDLIVGADEPGPKPLYHIRKTPAASSMAIISSDNKGKPQVLGGFGKGSVFFHPDTGSSQQWVTNVLLPETRSKIVCPHCKGKVVAYRPKVSDRCETCHKKLPEGAKYCPADRTPRPAPPKPWKYCPLCGKPVDYED